MHTFESNYPQLCYEVGLNCEDCTAETARELAKSCRGLRGKAVGQLFVQIHPDPACARMHSHFAKSYLEATVEAPPERRPVMAETARPRIMAAVA